MPEGHATIQRDLNRPEKWNDRNNMEFKGKILHLGKNNPKQQHILGATSLGKNFAGKTLKVLVNTKLNVSQTCSHTSMCSKIE